MSIQELNELKALNYIEKKGIAYKEATATELTLDVCPFCGNDKNKFYINKESGLYDCKVCAQQGNLYRLQAQFGDLESFTSVQTAIDKKYTPIDSAILAAYENALLSSKPALEYLKSRGFTQQTIKHFKIGLTENEWITIPHFQDNKLWNVKQRNFVKKEFKRIAGQPTVIFNIDNTDVDKALLIVESETDCIAAWQMGVKNVVGLTGGAQGFKPEWMSFFSKFKQIYICLNSDEVGQKGAEKVANKIGIGKCRNVILPTNDINDYLINSEYSSESFKKYIIDNATQYTVKDIATLEEYVNELDDWFDSDGNVKGLELVDFPQLNSVLGGFKAEDFILLSGDSGVGKTTLSFNFMLQLIKNDHKCLFFSLEGKIMYYILRMMSAHTDIEYNHLRDNPEEWEVLKDEFAEYPLYFYSGSQADLTPKKLSELLPAAVQLYDIEFVVIDNLQKLVRGADNRFARVSEAVSALKDLAVDLKIPVLLITHITKRGKGAVGPITMHDAKDSSTIYQDADIYLIIAHDSNGKCSINIEKNRMGEGGIQIPYENKQELGKFCEIENTKKTNTDSGISSEIIDDIAEESYEL